MSFQRNAFGKRTPFGETGEVGRVKEILKENFYLFMVLIKTKRIVSFIPHCSFA